MNRDDVIRMAQECHLIGMRPHLDGIYQESLERFAALVAAAAKAEEREACAKECDALASLLACHGDRSGADIAASLRDAIRARGETK